MPATYEPIASTLLSSNTNTVSFSSISQAYTDLVVVFNGTSTTNTDFRIRVGNGSVDTNTNYSRNLMFGYPGGLVGAREPNVSYWTASAYTNRGNAIIEIMDYSNTATFKTALIRNDISTDITYAGVNLWRSTSAINTITFTNPNYNFTSGSSFTIYGIKAA